MDCNLPGFSGVAQSCPGDDTGGGSHSLFQDQLNPGIKPGSPALQANSLPLSHQGWENYKTERLSGLPEFAQPVSDRGGRS